MASKKSFKEVVAKVWNVVAWAPAVLVCIITSIVHGAVEIVKDVFHLVGNVITFLACVLIDMVKMFIVPKKAIIFAHRSMIPQPCDICGKYACKEKGKVVFLRRGERFVHVTCRDEELRKEAEERRNRVNNSPYGEELAELLLASLLSK